MSPVPGISALMGETPQSLRALPPRADTRRRAIWKSSHHPAGPWSPTSSHGPVESELLLCVSHEHKGMEDARDFGAGKPLRRSM